MDNCRPLKAQLKSWVAGVVPQSQVGCLRVAVERSPLSRTELS